MASPPSAPAQVVSATGPAVIPSIDLPSAPSTVRPAPVAPASSLVKPIRSQTQRRDAKHHKQTGPSETVERIVLSDELGLDDNRRSTARPINIARPLLSTLSVFMFVLHYVVFCCVIRSFFLICRLQPSQTPAKPPAAPAPAAAAAAAAIASPTLPQHQHTLSIGLSAEKQFQVSNAATAATAASASASAAAAAAATSGSDSASSASTTASTENTATAPPAEPLPHAGALMSDAEFMEILSAFQQAATAKEREAMLQDIAKSRCLTCKQAGSLLRTIKLATEQQSIFMIFKVCSATGIVLSHVVLVFLLNFVVAAIEFIS